MKSFSCKIDATNYCMFSLDEGTDVGRDDGTPVTEDYKVPFAFSGTIKKVEVKLRQEIGRPAFKAVAGCATHGIFAAKSARHRHRERT
jgi:hypothetical protein